MSKYKKGDMVLIKKDLDENEWNGIPEEEIKIMQGKSYKVEKVNWRDHYWIKTETGRTWFISDEMISCGGSCPNTVMSIL